MNWKKMPRHVREHGMKLAMALLGFSLLIMRIQLLAGRAFVLAHPLAATSWTHPWVQRCLVELPQTWVLPTFDFCMFGMVTKVHRTPLKKATRLMSNDPDVLKRFAGVLCDGTHAHAWCMGCEGGEKRSRYAQYCPDCICSCLAQCAAGMVHGVGL